MSIRNDKLSGWNAVVSLATSAADDSRHPAFHILDHPSTEHTASNITYQEHIPTTTGTAAYYKDVAPLLDQVLR